MIEVKFLFHHSVNIIFNLEQKANTIINERQSQYEQEIKDYQNKLDKTTHDFQNSQLELTKLQEENNSNEKKSNETINTLKHDYDSLKNELNELQDRGLVSSFSLSLMFCFLLNRSYTKYGIK